MTDDEIKESIKKEEGLRLQVYRDSLGNLTVGYGHLIRSGAPITKDMADSLFEIDYIKAVSGYNSMGLDLDPVRRAAIIDMIFNLGIGGVKKFEHFLFALKYQDWVRAANELMDSEYARQVPNRAKRNHRRILTGKL